MICVSYKNPKVKNLIDVYYDTDDIDVKAPEEIPWGGKVYIKYGISRVSYVTVKKSRRQ